jgi:hypothetical protein
VSAMGSLLLLLSLLNDGLILVWIRPYGYDVLQTATNWPRSTSLTLFRFVVFNVFIGIW